LRAKSFEPLAVVLAAIARRDDADASVYDLGELRLRLNRLGAAQPIKPLNDKHGPLGDAAFLDRAEEYAERALFDVTLVVGGQTFIPQ
jgi:hypothetical protein